MPCGQCVENLVDRGREAHVQHTIGFIENEHLEGVARDMAALDVVDQPARGGDHHVDAVGEGARLRLHAHPAVDSSEGEIKMLPVHLGVLQHLLRQLARRHEHQGPKLPAPPAGESLENGQEESRCLAGPGLGRTDDVLPGQDGRDGLLLNRGRLAITTSLEGPEDLGAEAEGLKSRLH